MIDDLVFGLRPLVLVSGQLSVVSCQLLVVSGQS